LPARDWGDPAILNYFQRLEQFKDDLVRELERRGVQGRHLQFGGPGEKPRRIIAPTDARSEFLANRAMGDWAEGMLASLLSSPMPAWKVIRYGDSDRI